jgi:hypothetical protein
MAYTPPTGNAITFIFGTGGYVPPLGSAIPIVFGGSLPPPPPGSVLLPFMVAKSREHDREFVPPPRRFAFVSTAAPALVVPYRRNWQSPEAPEPIRPLRRTFTFMPIDDDDVMVTLLF